MFLKIRKFSLVIAFIMATCCIGIAQTSPIVKVVVNGRNQYYQSVRLSSGLDFGTVRQRIAFQRYLPPGEIVPRSASVVNFETSAEYSSVVSALRSKGVDLRDLWTDGYRLGLSPLCTLNWYWNTEFHPANYINWAPGEPNNPDHPQHQLGYNNCSSPFFEAKLFMKTSTGQLGNIRSSVTRGTSNLPMGYIIEY
jgi:hypothetical protein